ncbi:hypothetical protein MHZ92_03610 [Sporosarcina sp. ACRSL]|uniref:hypothetical protein n=1 Tax=Sporosarcina sp. ACRSL TaxID=2918215 RepID=UPI001EF5AE21|nr:hypothetical protein [Sporosarcina sp. ACRSL]MCG7343206.1 hypothetical protein [Sporosarcina sp. ACRSL]
MGETIYIVLTDTGTLLSKAIGMYTRKDLNHASIAFDEQLTEIYSFGRKQQYNPFLGGFVRENVMEGIFREADCAVYRCEVSTEAYLRIRQKIAQFELNQRNYKYNFIGLFGVALNREIRRKRAFFCSQFVATVLQESEPHRLMTRPCLTMPHHLACLPHMELVYEGDLKTYVMKVRGLQMERPLRMGLLKSLAFRLLA